MWNLLGDFVDALGRASSIVVAMMLIGAFIKKLIPLWACAAISAVTLGIFVWQIDVIAGIFAGIGTFVGLYFMPRRKKS